VTVSRTPEDLIALLSDVERQLTALANGDEVLRTLTRVAVDRVPGADYAGITRARDGVFTTVAPTDDVVTRVDLLQYQLGGPCVDAVNEATVLRADDISTDPRWTEFGPRAAQETGVHSMLSYRLYLENDPDVVAALNLYSTQRAAFDDAAESTGIVLATAGALAVAGAMAREKASNLEIALVNSREIGIAIGVLMNQHKLTREQAFDLLRLASQGTHRKLFEIARDVGDTGALPILPERRSQPRR
jgi:ANTAR domain-containing protein/GAF domain-containing protein